MTEIGAFINAQTEDTTPDKANDLVLTYDASASAVKKVKLVNVGGTGDVVGPGSATNNHLATFDGTTGKLLKDGGVVPTVPAPASAVYNRSAGTYTTTSATFVDVDSTNLSLTITTGARRVMIVIEGMVSIDVAPNSADFDVEMDGTRLGQAAGLVRIFCHTADWWPLSYVYITDVLTAASHTFKLQWKRSANTASLYGAGSAWPARFAVVELLAG